MSLAVLSPYHLTTREPPAMAALSIADEVVTFLPTLAERTDRDEAERAARDEPAYLDMIESWQWSMPLWEAGLLSMGDSEASPDAQIRRVSEQIRADDRFAALRPLMPARALDEDRVMRNVARDVLRGGPDPAVSVPVAAGLDRFAVLRNGYVMRSAAASVAQRAESRMTDKLFALAIPVLLQASAGRIARLRTGLKEPRQMLALALDDASRAVAAGEPAEASSGWRALSSQWAACFNDHRAQLTEPCDDEDGLHVIEGMLSIEGVSLPMDAVLRSSVAALRAVSHPRAVSAPTQASTSVLPAIHDPLEGLRVFSLVCRVVGRR